MSEEEIIQCCQNLIVTLPIKHINSDAIQGLLDLYNKEKEKNKQLFKEYNKRVSTIIKYEQTIKTAIDEFEDVLEE